VLSVVGPEYLFLFAMKVIDRCRNRLNWFLLIEIGGEGPHFQNKKDITHKPGMIKASISIEVITASN
jgi:hypothetical protein